jgi:hypothetical protein
VDFNWNGESDGSVDRPYRTLADGVAGVVERGEVFLIGTSTPETARIDKPLTLIPFGDIVRVGASPQ